MTDSWNSDDEGVLTLPSGRLVRGRGLRQPLPPGIEPTFGLYLTGSPPTSIPWEMQWMKWRDFWLPSDRITARETLINAWERALVDRVEIACGGGNGRTGTALACLAVLDGMDASTAIAFVRAKYRRHAVETPWQRAYVKSFAQTE
jgi:hypothetical protein